MAENLPTASVPFKSNPDVLTFNTLWAYSADNKLVIFFLFSQKTGFDISCKLSSLELAWNVKSFFLGKIRKNISKCHLLKILPRVLNGNMSWESLWFLFQEKGKYEVITGQQKVADDVVEFWADLLGKYPSVIAIIDPLRKQVTVLVENIYMHVPYLF